MKFKHNISDKIWNSVDRDYQRKESNIDMKYMEDLEEVIDDEAKEEIEIIQLKKKINKKYK
jgi:hypothetical protein